MKKSFKMLIVLTSLLNFSLASACEQDREELCAKFYGFPQTDHLCAKSYRGFACLYGSSNQGCDKDWLEKCPIEQESVNEFQEILRTAVQ